MYAWYGGRINLCDETRAQLHSRAYLTQVATSQRRTARWMLKIAQEYRRVVEGGGPMACKTIGPVDKSTR